MNTATLDAPQVVKVRGRFYVSGGTSYYLFGPDTKKACEAWVQQSAETRAALAAGDVRREELAVRRVERLRREPDHEDNTIEFVRLGMTYSLEWEIQVSKERTFVGCLAHMAYGRMKPAHALGLLLPFFRKSHGVMVGRLSEPFVEIGFPQGPERQQLCADLVSAAWESGADIVAVYASPRPSEPIYLRKPSKLPADLWRVRMKWDG
ncbi:hypothetical protein [Actinocorallia libanotica]|uniref:GNAT family N-acetyltransferase n=1 Tax=Actinocorallia libanotica TaxID=46162 RepID=A0ABN1Q0Q4_9ACTN